MTNKETVEEKNIPDSTPLQFVESIMRQREARKRTEKVSLPDEFNVDLWLDIRDAADLIRLEKGEDWNDGITVPLDNSVLTIEGKPCLVFCFRLCPDNSVYVSVRETSGGQVDGVTCSLKEDWLMAKKNRKKIVKDSGRNKVSKNNWKRMINAFILTQAESFGWEPEGVESGSAISG